jgi:hypothetical protein
MSPEVLFHFWALLYRALTISGVGVRVMMFNATCNNISFILWHLVLLVEKTTDPVVSQ